MPKKHLLAAALLFALVPALLAADTEGIQVPIPAKHRVRNLTGSQCVWASLETLARYHDITSVNRLTDVYKGIANPDDVANVLNPAKVKYVMVLHGLPPRTDLLKDWCAKGWGATVSLRTRTPNISHVVTCVHYKDGKVGIIDNMDPDLKVQVWSEEKFLDRWDGWMILLYK